ncbi:hypothetical protein C8Q75DRAFT_735076 [Abortiporus biennis]|nr:hypothetical protein C8Q75DRAFT_735076 [Abortiporus biennis]
MPKRKISGRQAQKCLDVLRDCPIEDRPDKIKKIAKHFKCTTHTVRSAITRANNGKPLDSVESDSSLDLNELGDLGDSDSDDFTRRYSTRGLGRSFSPSLNNRRTEYRRPPRSSSPRRRYGHEPGHPSSSSSSSQMSASQALVPGKFLKSVGLDHLKNVFPHYGYIANRDFEKLKTHSAQTKELVLKEMMNDGQITLMEFGILHSALTS